MVDRTTPLFQTRSQEVRRSEINCLRSRAWYSHARRQPPTPSARSPATPRGFSARSVAVCSEQRHAGGRHVRPAQRLLRCTVSGNRYKKGGHERRCDLATPEHGGDKRYCWIENILETIIGLPWLLPGPVIQSKPFRAHFLGGGDYAESAEEKKCVTFWHHGGGGWVPNASPFTLRLPGFLDTGKGSLTDAQVGAFLCTFKIFHE